MNKLKDFIKNLPDRAKAVTASGFIIAIVISTIVLGTSLSSPDSTILSDKEIEGLEIKDINLEYNEGVSTYTAKVTNTNSNNDTPSTIYDSSIFNIKETNFTDKMKKMVTDIICSSFVQFLSEKFKDVRSEYIRTRLEDLYPNINWNASVCSKGGGFNISKNDGNYYMIAEIKEYYREEKKDIIIFGIKN